MLSSYPVVGWSPALLLVAACCMISVASGSGSALCDPGAPMIRVNPVAPVAMPIEPTTMTNTAVASAFGCLALATELCPSEHSSDALDLVMLANSATGLSWQRTSALSARNSTFTLDSLDSLTPATGLTFTIATVGSPGLPAPLSISSAPHLATSLAVVDADASGYNDVVLVGSLYGVRVFFSLGLPPGPSIRPSLVVTSEQPLVALEGTLVSPVSLPLALASSSYSLFLDVTGDGREDLVQFMPFHAIGTGVWTNITGGRLELSSFVPLMFATQLPLFLSEGANGQPGTDFCMASYPSTGSLTQYLTISVSCTSILNGASAASAFSLSYFAPYVSELCSYQTVAIVDMTAVPQSNSSVMPDLIALVSITRDCTMAGFMTPMVYYDSYLVHWRWTGPPGFMVYTDTTIFSSTTFEMGTLAVVNVISAVAKCPELIWFTGSQMFVFVNPCPGGESGAYPSRAAIAVPFTATPPRVAFAQVDNSTDALEIVAVTTAGIQVFFDASVSLTPGGVAFVQLYTPLSTLPTVSHLLVSTISWANVLGGPQSQIVLTDPAMRVIVMPLRGVGRNLSVYGEPVVLSIGQLPWLERPPLFVSSGALGTRGPAWLSLLDGAPGGGLYFPALRPSRMAVALVRIDAPGAASDIVPRFNSTPAVLVAPSAGAIIVGGLLVDINGDGALDVLAVPLNQSAFWMPRLMPLSASLFGAPRPVRTRSIAFLVGARSLVAGMMNVSGETREMVVYAVSANLSWPSGLPSAGQPTTLVALSFNGSELVERSALVVVQGAAQGALALGHVNDDGALDLLLPAGQPSGALDSPVWIVSGRLNSTPRYFSSLTTTIGLDRTAWLAVQSTVREPGSALGVSARDRVVLFRSGVGTTFLVTGRLDVNASDGVVFDIMRQLFTAPPPVIPSRFLVARAFVARDALSVDPNVSPLSVVAASMTLASTAVYSSTDPRLRLATNVGIFTGPPRSMAIADMDGDSFADFVLDVSNSAPTVFFNRGGTLASTMTLSTETRVIGTDTAAKLFAAADFTGDGVIDLAILNPAGQTVAVYVNTGERVRPDFTLETTVALSVPLSSIQVFGALDVDGNGAPDLVVSGSPGCSLVVLLNSAAVTPLSFSQTALNVNSGVCAESDQLRGVVVNFARDEPSVVNELIFVLMNVTTTMPPVGWLRLNQSSGALVVGRLNAAPSAAPVLQSGAIVSGLAATDLTGDSLADVVVTMRTTSTSLTLASIVWYQAISSAGLFAAPVAIASSRSYSVLSLVAGDFDNSGGADDLFVSFTPPTRVLFNRITSALFWGQNISGRTVPFSDSLLVSPLNFGGVGGVTNVPSIGLDGNNDGLLDLFLAAQYVPGNSFWSPSVPIAPRSLRVPVELCGWTLECVRQTIVRAARCTGDVVLLPSAPGKSYSGCPRGGPIRIGKSIMLLGEDPMAVVINCTADAARAPNRAAFGFQVIGGASVTISGLTFVGLSSPDINFGGGALRVSEPGSALVLDRVAFMDCSARSPAGQVSVLLSALGFGGAVLVDSDTRLDVRNCTFTRCSAGFAGGAIAAIGRRHSVTICSSVFLDCSAVRYGGSMHFEAATQAPGDCAVLKLHDTVLTGSRASGGTTPSEGGAFSLIAYDGAINATWTTTQTLNAQSSGSGGALAIRSFGSSVIRATIVGGVIGEATATTGFGGALVAFARESSSLELQLTDGAWIRGGQALSGSGGAIAMLDERPVKPLTSPLVVTLARGARVTGSSAAKDGGALVGLGVVSVALLSGATLEGNTASRVGGAIALAGARAVATLHASILVGNSARLGGVFGLVGGGTAYLDSLGSPMGLHSVPAGSVVDPASCVSPGGATLVVDGSGGTRIEDNTASYGGLGFVCDARVRLVNAPASIRLASSVTTAPPVAPICGAVFALCGVPPTLASAPSCRATAVALLGAPFVDMDAGMAAAVQFAGALVTLGYGPAICAPALALSWAALAPSAPTGAALGVATVELRDSLGQVVRDPNVFVSLGVSAVSASEFVLVGGSPVSAFWPSTTVSFAEVSLAALSSALIPRPAALTISVARGGTLSALSLDSSVLVTECPPGSGLASGDDAAICAPCAAGTYAALASLAPCLACGGNPSDNFLPGATRCIACPAGTQAVVVLTDEASNATDVGGARQQRQLNCTCASGFWSPAGSARGPDDACTACPSGASCAGGARSPVALPGFFPTDDPAVFIECPTRSACAGGAPFRCARGYRGRLCGQCAPGFFALSGRCVRCSNQTGPLLALAALLATVLVAALVALNARADTATRFTALIIGLNSLQISTAYGRLNLFWPEPARQVLSLLSVVNLNFDLAGPECSMAPSVDAFLFKYMLTIALPVMFLVPFALVLAVGWLLVRSGRLPPPHWSSVTWPALIDSARRSYVQVLSLLYMALVSMTLSYFRCSRDRDGRYTLEAAPYRRCYDTRWWSVMPVAVVFSAVYGLGIPLLVFVLLRRARASCDEVTFSLRYAFLVARFKWSQFAFEGAIMARKLGVVLAMTVFVGATSKAALAFAVLAASLVHKLVVRPYAEPRHNAIGALCLGSCAAVLWAATLDASTARLILVMLALVVNLGAIVLGVFLDVAAAVALARQASKAASSIGFSEPVSSTRGAFSNEDDVGIELCSDVRPSGRSSATHSFVTDSCAPSVLLPPPLPFEPMSDASLLPPLTDA